MKPMNRTLLTLLLLELRPVWSHLCATLWPHTGIHLPCTGGHAMGLLVLGVWGLWSPLWMGHSTGWRMHCCVSCNLWGPS